MRRLRPYVALLAAGLVAASAADVFAQGVDFTREKARGYFFYEPEPEEEEPEKVPPKPPPVPPKSPSKEPQKVSPKGPTPFSVAWLREELPRVRDLAIDNPTVENVTAYRYLQRIMLDKGSRFEEAWQRSILKEPLLDENLRRPISTFGGDVLDTQAREAREATARALARQAGLWFFYRSDCEFCVAQAPVLKALSETYGFRVLPISLDGKPLPGGTFPRYEINRGQAEAWGITMTPALVLVRPSTKEHAPISQGLLPMEEIVSRTIRAASEAGWLDERTVAATRPVRPIYADSGTLARMPEPVSRDPVALAEYLRRELRRQATPTSSPSAPPVSR